MKTKLQKNARQLAAIAIAISAAAAAASCTSFSSPSDPPPSPPPTASAPASQPITGHWLQDQRLRLLMAELSKQNPTWPAGMPREPEDPAAAALPHQFEEIAVLAHALCEAADHLPEVARHIQMSQADRAGFLAEARTLREQAMELQAAANRRNIEHMQEQMEGINAICISCHSRYRDFSGQINRTQASRGGVKVQWMSAH